MEFKGWDGFEDLLKACGYTNSNKDNNSKKDCKNNSTNMGCNDILNGFQSLNPELFIVIGEILGNIVAGSIPFNVQNAIGNWLQLVGQVIETYNAQQQYFQGGPGRYFNPIYYNVNNPFCSSNSTSSTQNTSSSDNNKKIKALEDRINQLTDEIEKLKNKINK
ncbi:hypothetical protein [Clostridium cibarium]|uniref:Uncharacterized protein n=1 Tax=Clostridium cibarium TaxID=2762247 RepID=A0ABR8PTD9_9CLOT|nr:hypothetical protein [Clostridium cibarium]MBD7911441.1 hypothetical protein [Clostridium cibarium]